MSPNPQYLEGDDELDDFCREIEEAEGVTRRYELLKGKRGPYFNDTTCNFPMPLNHVLDRLNEIDDLKARLFAANKRKRGKKW